MARKKADPVSAAGLPKLPETIAERIDSAYRHCGGTMPVTIVVRTQDDLDHANAILKKNPKIAALIDAELDDFQ
jgi:hypothetical protein